MRDLDPPFPKYQLKLFITGQTAKSDMAIANIHQIFAELGIICELDIIDVLEQPQIAEEEKIIATPTLVRVSPPPVRKIIGDMSDEHKVRMGLGLSNLSGQHRKETPL